MLSLDVYASGGDVHLLTGRLEEAGRSLWHQVSRDDGRSWSSPVRVDADAPPPQTFRRGNDAQIAAAGRTLVAVWTGGGTGWGGTGPLVTAVSRDGGKSWRRGASPADDASTATHSFIELSAEGTVFKLAWIDSRDKVMGLRYAQSIDGGASWSPNVTVDAQTCECCWNSMAAAGQELFVMYRGHTPRDMALAASAAGTGWRRIGTVGAFNWDINACPETGGALAVTPSRTMHALVWTGKENALGLYHLQSADAGRTWSTPQRMGGPDARHADLVALPAGAIAAVWDDGKDELVRAAVSHDHGKTWSGPYRLSEPAARASHPRVIATHGGFRVFWTEIARDGTKAQWRTTRISAP